MMKLSLSLYALSLFALLYVEGSTKALINQQWWNSYKTQSWDLGSTSLGCESKCCPGRNTSCYSTGRKMNSHYSAAQSRCYCDESCLDMKDCCEDYSVQCQAVDCKVGEWSDYGECSRPCGFGSQVRQRAVLQEPRNGGNECPRLKETIACRGKRCKAQRHLGGKRGNAETAEKPVNDEETAKIMPAQFAAFRQIKRYNPDKDIRKNLFYRYYQTQEEQRSYCSTYKITSTRNRCFSDDSPSWANVLNKEVEICVECQKHAMDGKTTCTGHGLQGKQTFWTAINAHGCHGWWERITPLSACSCNRKSGLDFIFV